jgi:multiple sugar transport system ATP-binding protein
MTMADKIVVMHDGIVEQMGSPLDLYDYPDNMFVAGFIGSPSMNFLKGRVADDGSATFRAEGGAVLPLASVPEGAAGRAAVYGIRPEHTGLADDGVPAEVTVVEPTGAEIQVFAKLGEEQITAVFHERHRFQPGETIRLAPERDQVHLFDAETGQRLGGATRERRGSPDKRMQSGGR